VRTGKKNEKKEKSEKVQLFVEAIQIVAVYS